jgi:hypothetical protein
MIARARDTGKVGQAAKAAGLFDRARAEASAQHDKLTAAAKACLTLADACRQVYAEADAAEGDMKAEHAAIRRYLDAGRAGAGT